VKGWMRNSERRCEAPKHNGWMQNSERRCEAPKRGTINGRSANEQVESVGWYVWGT